MPDEIWTITGALAKSRLSHTATLLANGSILVAGGVDGRHTILNSAEPYDLATGK